MEIKGIVDLSLVDWDGKLSSVIFLPGCNFRCPFCHNYALVLHPEKKKTIPFERAKISLEKQRNWLDGVCITGGEPTLHRNLPEFCSKLKDAGLTVKIDTNGTDPKMIRRLIEQRLVDYVAMDIKAPLTVEKYSKATGVDAKRFLGKVKETVGILLDSKVDYEFRTTVVPTLHDEKDIEMISQDVKNCRKYVLQAFNVSLGEKTLDPAFSELKPFTDKEMKKLLGAARKNIPNAKIR